MKIELRNIQYDEGLSDQSHAFTADLYINNFKAGIASDNGAGEKTQYMATSSKGAELVKKAEGWCRNLPPVSETGRDKFLPVDMTLELYLADIVHDHVLKNIITQYNKEKERDMRRGIIVGVPDGLYRKFRYKYPIDALLNVTWGAEAIKRHIHDKVLPSLKPDEKILNTNIPPEIIEFIGIPKDKIVSLEPKETLQRKIREDDKKMKEKQTGKRKRPRG